MTMTGASVGNGTGVGTSVGCWMTVSGAAATSAALDLFSESSAHPLNVVVSDSVVISIFRLRVPETFRLEGFVCAMIHSLW
jgi:endonuclease V-like protein UPF0215 family